MTCGVHFMIKTFQKNNPFFHWSAAKSHSIYKPLKQFYYERNQRNQQEQKSQV